MRFKYFFILFFLIFSIFSYSRCVNLNVKGPELKEIYDKARCPSGYRCMAAFLRLSPDKKYFLWFKKGYLYILDKNLKEIKMLFYFGKTFSEYKSELLKRDEYRDFATNNIFTYEEVFNGEEPICPEVFWIKKGLLFCQSGGIFLYDFCNFKTLYKLDETMVRHYKNGKVYQTDDTNLTNFVVTDKYVFFSVPHKRFYAKSHFLWLKDDMVSNKLCRLSLSDGKVEELIKYEGRNVRYFYLRFVKDGKVYYFDFTKDWDCYFYTLDIESGRIERIDFAHNILLSNYSRRGMPYVYYRYGTISLVYYDRLYVFDGKTMKLKKMLKRPFKLIWKRKFYGPAFFLNDDIICYVTGSGGRFHKVKNDDSPYQFRYEGYLWGDGEVCFYSLKQDKVIYKYSCGWIPEEIVMEKAGSSYTFYFSYYRCGGIEKKTINLDEIRKNRKKD